MSQKTAHFRDGAIKTDENTSSVLQVYVDGTVKEYEEWTNPANHAEGRKLCNGGKLSVFYSHTHAKFVGSECTSLQ